MAVTRMLWVLLLIPVCLNHMTPPAATITGSLFEVTANLAIINGSTMTGTQTATMPQCAALCGRLSDCGGFIRWPLGDCLTLLKTSMQFSFRREVPGAQSAVLPAHTCRQRLLQDKNAPSGVQRLAGWSVPVFCDQELDGGGWTLLVAAVTGGWTVEQVLARNEGTPSLSSDYSMLRRADRVLKYGNGVDFSYRLEGQAQTGRQQWGAIFTAEQPESLVLFDNGMQGEADKQFNQWGFGPNNIGKCIPWINNSTDDGMLLKTKDASSEYGTIISGKNAPPGFDHSPWMLRKMKHSGTVLYWIREN